MEQGPPEGMEALIGLVGLGAALIGALVGLAVLAVICYILYGCYKRIPEEHRQMEPGMVWLLFIPCFNLVWNFFVYLRLSRSFQSYFEQQGDTSKGDCYYTVGLIYCISAVCSMVPYLNCLAGPATLVLLIVYLVKVNELKNQIPENPGGTASAPQS